MFEVSPLLHLVAASLEGATDLDEVAHRVAGSANRAVSAESVSYLIEHKLRPLGILAPEPSAEGRSAAPERDGPALGLAIRSSVVPASTVRAAARLLRPLFLPPAVLAVLVAVAAFDCWLLLGHDGAVLAPAVMFAPTSLLAVIGLTLAAAVFHELGHATACRYGGAKPGVIGVGIYLLWPVLYNDLNDSYRLPRRARIRADLGGVYFNAVFIVGLAGAYLVSGFQPLLVAIVVQHVAIAQQFLPFVRLDGYYLVSDIAGIPDLFGHIRPSLAALRRRGGRAGALADLTPRARAIVLAWVMATVPLLGGLTVLLVLKLPSVLSGGWEALRFQVGMATGAFGAGETVTALLHCVQAAVLAVPFVGLTGVALRIVQGRRRRGAPAVAPAAPPVATPAPTAPAWPVAMAALVVVTAYMASRFLGRRRLPVSR